LQARIDLGVGLTMSHTYIDEQLVVNLGRFTAKVVLKRQSVLVRAIYKVLQAGFAVLVYSTLNNNDNNDVYGASASASASVSLRSKVE